ncbi:MAG: hypothetical protein ACLSVD_03980 [Eggerthellaceae bacterium]
MAFMKASGAFDRDNADELTLTSRGRYLMVVMMRQFFIGVNNLRDQARAAWWVRNASLSSATANNRLSASARTPKRPRICRGRFSCVPSRVWQRVPLDCELGCPTVSRGTRLFPCSAEYPT